LKDKYAERGFVHVPATGTHGGVIATGEIRRDATLSLAALRLLAVREGTGDAGMSADRTLALRRYILGLALVAFTSNASSYLRQGCNLVPSEKPREVKLVHSDGTRDPLKLKLADVLIYATTAAKAFGVEKGKEVVFDPKLAVADINGEGTAQTTRTARARRARARRAATSSDATDATGGTP
jgi:CRISPR-associated protein Csb1